MQTLNKSIVYNLPAPGGLVVNSGTEPEYCIEANMKNVTTGTLPNLYLSYHKAPDQNFRMEYTDLAPGLYHILATERPCNAASGPARKVGSALVTVHPGELNEVHLDMTRSRDKYSKDQQAGKADQIFP